jgi:hypothetical protein
MINSDGEELHVWYKNYLNSLEENGYTCD